MELFHAYHDGLMSKDEEKEFEKLLKYPKEKPN